MNYIPRTEKRKKVPACKMLECSGSLSSTMLPIFSWKLRIITNRGSSTISPASKLKVLCHYKMTSWRYIVTKSSIKDYVGFRDPPLVCLISVQNITKKSKKSTNTRCEICPNLHHNEANFVVLVSLLLTLNIFYTFNFFYFNFEQVNAGRQMLYFFHIYRQKLLPRGAFQERCYTSIQSF